MIETQKTRHALELIRSGETWKRSAEIAGVSQSTIAQALKKERCKCCGQTIKPTKMENHHEIRNSECTT